MSSGGDVATVEQVEDFLAEELSRFVQARWEELQQALEYRWSTNTDDVVRMIESADRIAAACDGYKEAVLAQSNNIKKALLKRATAPIGTADSPEIK